MPDANAFAAHFMASYNAFLPSRRALSITAIARCTVMKIWI